MGLTEDPSWHWGRGVPEGLSLEDGLWKGVVGDWTEAWASRKMAAIFALWLWDGSVRAREGVLTRFLPMLESWRPGVLGSSIGASSCSEG